MEPKVAGLCPCAKTVVWGILATFLVVWAPAKGAWWGDDGLPETFPPLVEELNREAWLASAHTLFPARYTAFQDNIKTLRRQFLIAKDEWWPTEDARTFEHSYNKLVQEGRLLLQASRQKRNAQQQEIVARLEQEESQLARLRNLIRLFNLKRDVHALSKAYGYLEEATRLKDLGKLTKAQGKVMEAIKHLRQVERNTMAHMKRYADSAQLAQWKQWVQDTIRWTATQGATAFVVVKASGQLQVYQKGKFLTSYPVDLGFNGLEEKRHEGDGATPEGKFHVLKKKGKGETKFYKALLLNYPTPAHIQQFREAKAAGRIPTNQSIGGLIEIHGRGSENEDLTKGCVGLENADMDTIFQIAKAGMPVTIVGAVQEDNQVVTIIQEIEAHVHNRTQWISRGTMVS